MLRSFSPACCEFFFDFMICQLNERELIRSSFQKVQTLPALQASFRILPSLVVGVVTNFTTGIFVDRVPVFWAVLIANVLAAGSSLLMSVIDPRWPYWYDAFFAQVSTSQAISALAAAFASTEMISDCSPRRFSRL